VTLTEAQFAAANPSAYVQEKRDCPFCQIAAGNAPATIVREWDNALAIVPLNPVVDGHVLVIPKAHVRNFTDVPWLTAQIAERAAELAKPPCNLITSAGPEATQSVFHLHWHIVPRAEGDGLALPWYSGGYGGRGGAA